MQRGRAEGKDVLTLALMCSAETLRKTWAKMGRRERDEMFGNGHAQEIDNLIKYLGKHDTSHLEGDPFGEQLADLHNGHGMNDHKAARVLHTASGVRMAHRAAEGPKKTGREAHEMTMKILNARYKEK